MTDAKPNPVSVRCARVVTATTGCCARSLSHIGPPDDSSRYVFTHSLINTRMITYCSKEFAEKENLFVFKEYEGMCLVAPTRVSFLGEGEVKP